MLVQIFTAVLAASWGGTLLAFLVLVSNRLLENKLNVKLRYALLALVLVRFLFPITPESSISVLNYVPSPATLMQGLNQKENAIPRFIPNRGEASAFAEQTVKPQNSTNLDNQSDHTKDFEQNQSNFSAYPITTTSVLALLWLFGAFVVMVGALVFCVRFHLTNVKTSVTNDSKTYNSLVHCQAILNMARKVRIKCIPNLYSPMIAGFFVPTIYLPQGLVCNIEERELNHIILHELVHWKRHDTLRAALSFVAVSIHWFNPIAWLVLHHIKEERELLCDIHTLELLGEEHSTSYGSTILHVSQMQSHGRKGRVFQTAFFSERKQIKRRILMIKQFHHGFAKSFTALSVALFILLSTVTMTNATGTQDTTTMSGKQTFTLVSGSYQFFDSLERLSRYAGFDYLVPNNLPENYSVNGFYMNRMGRSLHGNNVVQIDYWYRVEPSANTAGEEHHFDYLVCKDSLIDYFNKVDVPALVKQPDQTPKPVTIGGVDGYTLKTYGELTAYTEDDRKIEGFYQCDYFIWQHKGLWYAVQYTDINSFEGKQSYSLLNLSEQEIGKIATSLTEPKNVSHTGYSIHDERPSYAVYDNFDLERIQKDWGFQPQLPLELPGLKAKSAYMSDVLMANSNIGVFSVNYAPTSDKQNKSVAEYSSSNSSLEYKLAEKEYLEQQGKTIEAPVIPWQKTTIHGHTVYYLMDSQNGTHYVWNCGSFDVDPNIGVDEQAILKQVLS